MVYWLDGIDLRDMKSDAQGTQRHDTTIGKNKELRGEKQSC